MGMRRKGHDLQSRKVKTGKKITGRRHTTHVNQGSVSSRNTGMECGEARLRARPGLQSREVF